MIEGKQGGNLVSFLFNRSLAAVGSGSSGDKNGCEETV